MKENHLPHHRWPWLAERRPLIRYKQPTGGQNSPVGSSSAGSLVWSGHTSSSMSWTSHTTSSRFCIIFCFCNATSMSVLRKHKIVYFLPNLFVRSFVIAYWFPFWNCYVCTLLPFASQTIASVTYVWEHFCKQYSPDSSGYTSIWLNILPFWNSVIEVVVRLSHWVSEHGIFSSPSFPNGKSSGKGCDLLHQVVPGSFIYINFQSRSWSSNHMGWTTAELTSTLPFSSCM